MRVATVHTDGTGPIEAHQVVLRRYSGDKYRRLPSSAKAKLHQLREEQKSNGGGGKAGGGKGKRRRLKEKDAKNKKKARVAAAKSVTTTATSDEEDDKTDSNRNKPALTRQPARRK